MNRLIVAGSRSITDPELIKSEMNRAWMDIGPFTLISGTAQGVDSISAALAKEAGIAVAHMPADWNRYGKSAGYRRNEQMARIATHVLVIWDGSSPGSRHMVEIADKLGVPVRLVDISTRITI